MSEQNGVPKHFVVVVPGYMGSKLRHPDTREVVWVNLSSIPWQPWQWKGWLHNLLATLEYPKVKLEPVGMMDDLVFLPPWGKMENYERLIKKLISMGYRADMRQWFGFEGEEPPYNESELNVYAFPYDWRQDNRTSARELGEAINRWSQYHPDAEVWIIAHSNGGVVARWYIEQLGGKDLVRRLFLLGSPWDGTPKALYMAFNGFDTLFSRKFDWFGVPQLTRNLVRSFPSIYQLIPVQNQFLRDANNNPVNPFATGVWLDNPHMQAMLQDGLNFSQQLGTNLSVETICFFGTRQPTPTSGRVLFAAADSWSQIEWDKEADAGDGTIPQLSAAHPRAKEKLPYPVSHGDIYVDEAVLEKLRFEMIDKYRQAERATLTTERLRIIFEQESSPDVEEGHKDFYNPGQTVRLWAEIHKREAVAAPQAESTAAADERWLPVTDAQIRVNLKWRQPLPGERNPAVKVELPKDLPEIYLRKSEETRGRYEGRVAAPLVEGYYEVRATVSVTGEPTLRLTELIAVEAAPDQAQLEAPEAEAALT